MTTLKKKTKAPDVKTGQLASTSNQAVVSAYNVSSNDFIRPNIRPDITSGLFGTVDFLGADGASGWVIDVAHPNQPVDLAVTVNGITIGTGTTTSVRQDISKIIGATARCAFRIEWDKTRLEEAVIDLPDQAVCPIMIRPAGMTRSLIIPTPPSVGEVIEWLKEGGVDGHFDHVGSDLNATGWAINSVKKNPVKVEILVNGLVAAEGSTHLPRPDFIASKHAYIMSGFKIQIPREALNQLENEIEAKVDRHTLPGSPIKLNLSNQITIVIPKIENGEAHVELNGWVGETLDGELHVDGHFAAVLKLTAKYDSSGKTEMHEGRWSLPDNLVDGQPHVYAFLVRHGKAVVRSDAVVRAYPQYSIHIDKVDIDAVSGWAFRHDRALPLQISLTKARQEVKRTVTNITRLDVLQMCDFAPSNTGFEFILPRAQVAHAAEYELSDVETGITIASITIGNPYESLTTLAQELAASEETATTLRSVLSQIILRSSGGPSYSFRRLPPPKRAKPRTAVDVIIPVYGGAIETMECIESVLAAQNNTPTHIVIINDCTPDILIRDYLASLEKRRYKELQIIHRTTNGGFSEAVNIGMIVSGDRDVILLNADTVVQSGWVDRLGTAAQSDVRIGTVTPLSNNAEICTVPYMCKSLPVNDLALAIEVDLAASSVNAQKIVSIPVAIGFCMYIRRDCIDEIGLFDAATWGRGYGEEVDFCLKATAMGWRHMMAADTFVVHRGNVSFGNEKLERIQESARKITERYPFYDQLIQRFLAADPAAPIRRAVNLELINNVLPQKRILHITHSFGGGTEQYIKDMSTLNIEAGYTPLILRFTTTGAAELDVDLSDTRLAGFFVESHKENYAAHEIDAIKMEIGKLGFERLHIHAPFGIPIAVLNWLSSTYPNYVTIHDYAWICPRVTLTTMDGRYCGEPQVEQCNRCIQFYKPHSGLKHLLEEAGGDVSAYREGLGSVIARAEKVFAGANDVVKRMEFHGLNGNYHAVPHPVTKNSVFAKSSDLANRSVDSGLIKVALFGGISDIKGFYILLECAENATKRNLPLHFIVFGYTLNDELCRARPNIEVLGKYKEEDLEGLVQRHRPHLSFFPNQWPETFSYTLSHSFRLGILPIVSDIGAPAERVREKGFGMVYDFSMSAADICDLLIGQAIYSSN